MVILDAIFRKRWPVEVALNWCDDGCLRKETAHRRDQSATPFFQVCKYVSRLKSQGRASDSVVLLSITSRSNSIPTIGEEVYNSKKKCYESKNSLPLRHLNNYYKLGSRKNISKPKLKSPETSAHLLVEAASSEETVVISSALNKKTVLGRILWMILPREICTHLDGKIIFKNFTAMVPQRCCKYVKCIMILSTKLNSSSFLSCQFYSVRAIHKAKNRVINWYRQ